MRGAGFVLYCSTLASLGSVLGCSADHASPSSEAAATERKGSQRDALTPAQASLSRWSGLTPVSLVPVSAANLPDGRVLLWAADDRFMYTSGVGRTYSVIFDPTTSQFTDRLVTETGHTMFCPGTALLTDGRLLVNGGQTSQKTSLFDPVSGAWSASAEMKIPRGYEASSPLPNGGAFTLGGSWSGAVGGKHGEVWREASGWRVLPGVPIDPFLSNDPTRDFGADSHLWFMPVGNGRLFHPGPGVTMHFIDTEGDGGVETIGPRGDDQFSVNGNAVMIDSGKVLKIGGQPGYEGMPATTNSYVIEVGKTVNVRKVGAMAYPRSFPNSVVLPNGQVAVIGGATRGFSFSDDNAVLVPEIFDPLTESFTSLPPVARPRNYHSVGLLLPDARVLSGGGGLCGGCSADHPDFQLLSPPYLFNSDGSPATRPVIVSAPSLAAHGTSFSVETDSSVSAFSIVRLSATTHATNNDQRRLSLSFQATGPTSYSVQVPSNAGWALPGNYMLFASSSAGVPSVAKIIHVGSTSPLILRSLGPQVAVQGVDAALQLELSLLGAQGNKVFDAQGLPPGLSLDASTGSIQGVPSTTGDFWVDVSVSDGTQTVSSYFPWKILDSSQFGNGKARYVKLEAVTEWSNQNVASAAEVNLLGENGAVLPRSGWTILADNAQGPEYTPSKAIDGNNNTFWHTDFSAPTPMPHALRIDLGAATLLTGLRYLPRQSGTNGSIRQYRVYLSYNGVNWGSPIAAGDFSTLGGISAEKTVMFSGGSAPTNHAPTLQQPAPGALTAGVPTSLSLQGADVDGDPLTYSATGLPSGLTLAAATGAISGVPTTAGSYNVTAVVSDGRGGSATTQFSWVVNAGTPPTPGTPSSARYVKLQGLSEISGNIFASGAELNLLGDAGQTLARTGWIASADSFENGYSPANLLDGNNASIWHTRFSGAAPAYPHWVTIDLRSSTAVSGLKLKPRSDNANGIIGDFEVYLSNDGVNWGAPVATGDFADLGPLFAEKTVTFSSGGGNPTPTNRAPTLQQPSVSALTVGVAASLTLQGSDPDGDALTFAASGLPAGLSLNPTSGVISGTPTTAGSYDVNASVSDGKGGVGTALFTWIVGTGGPVNSPPILQQPAPAALTVGTATSYGLVASDADGDTLTFSASGLPTGLTLAPGSSVISGTPTSAGSFTVNVSVSDGHGGSAGKQFSWLVNALNHAPTLQQPAPAALTVGTAVSFSLQASDSDGDALTYSASGLPAGLTLAAGTGVISGTPTTAASYTVNASVSDGRGGTASSPFSWLVNPALPATPSNARYVKLQALNELSGSVFASGAELNLLGETGQTLSRTGWLATADSFENGYPPANLLDGNNGSIWHTRFSGTAPAYPHWVRIDLGASKAITGLKYRPRGDNANGIISDFEVYLSNDGVNWGAPVATGDFADLGPTFAEKTVAFSSGGGNPTPTNQAPTLQQPSVSALTVGVAASLTLQASDPDGDVLGFAASGLPAGLSLNPTSGVISGTPTTAGSYDVNASVSDGKGGVGTALFTWVVGNGAPVNNPPVLQQPAPAALTVGVAASYTLQASDPDGDVLSFAASGLPTGLVLSSGSGAISGTPTTTGSFTVNASVSDGRGGSASKQFSWVVGTAAPVNHAPTLQQPAPAALTVGVAGSFTLQASDSDGDALTFAASGLPAGLTLTSATGVISGTPTTAASYTVSVTANDGRGGNASAQFAWIVNPAVPATSSSARYVKLQALNELSGSVFASGAELNLLGASGQTLTRMGWVATADSFENGYAPANLLDGNNGSIWHTRFSGTAPAYPHWVRIDLGASTAVSGLKYRPRGDNANGIIGDFEVYLSNDGVNWGAPVATGDFADLGPTFSEKTVTFSEGGTAPSPTNHSPTLQQPSAAALTVGVTASLTLQASDPDGDPLSFAASGLPAGMSLNPSTGAISGTPTTAGSYDVNASVTDGKGGMGTALFTWVVNSAVNHPPTLQQPAPAALTVGVATSLPLQASDVDADTLSFSATGLPAGLTLAAGTGVISGTPSAAATYNVTVTVSDARGGTASKQFSWVVNPATPGSTASARYVKLQALGEISGNIFASGAELNLLGASGQTLARTGWIASADSFENGYAPANLLDGNNGSIWHTRFSTPAPSYPHWVTIDLRTSTAITGLKYRPRADNANGIIGDFEIYLSNDGITWGAPVATGDFADLGPTFAEKTITFTVVAPPTTTNNAPTLQHPSVSPLTTGVAATLALSATDPDGDVLTFAATGLPPGLSIAPATGVISGAPTTAGIYDVSASVNDGKGGVGTAMFSWGVADPAPVVSAVVAPIVGQGATATYTATASGVGQLQYSWDFGDGAGPSAFTTAPSVSHVYASSGVYTAQLTVRTASGAAASTQFLQGVGGSVSTGQARASSSLALGSARLWVANIDNDSVSVFDAESYAKLQEVPVGSRPRTLAAGPDNRVWVTNKGDSSLSLIDPTTFAVTSLPLPRASAPYGIVVRSNDLAYVALEATGQVVAVNGAGVILATLDVGAHPRHLALSADGSKLLVARFISPFQAGEATANVQASLGGAEVRVVDTASLTVESTVRLQFSSRPDTEVSGRGLPNYLGAPAISPDGASAWVPSKQDNIQRGMLRSAQALTFETTVRAISSRIDLATATEDYAARFDHDNAGLASAAAYHPSGVYLFVALETSRQVAILDPVRRRELLRINTGIAPQALSVSADGSKLYVNNALSRNVSVFDLAPLVNRGAALVPQTATLASVQTEALSPSVLKGKQLFYDAKDVRLSRDSYLSCATCHNDGESDGRTWDFTSLGEGLRNTASLRGRGTGHGRLHWSGNFDEVQDFEGQIRVLAQGTGLMSDAELAVGSRQQPLGDAKQGISSDLDALAAYVSSLSSFDESPYRLPSGELTRGAALGEVLFADECTTCHGGAAFTDSASFALHDIGTIKPSSGKRLGAALLGLDTPTLRDVWATAPYLHDGSAATLADAVSAHDGVVLEGAELENLVEYLQQIGKEEPGFTP